MSVGTLQSSLGRQGRASVVASTPPRLRQKGPLGPEFYRRCPAEASGPRQSAVERLEADKSKYVKSPVALSKQQPVGPPVMRKPLLSPNTALRPTRKSLFSPTTLSGAPLDLEHLSNLINGVSDTAVTPLPPISYMSLGEGQTANQHTAITLTTVATAITTTNEVGSGASRLGQQPEVTSGTQHGGTDWSSPAKVRIKGPLNIENSMGSPTAAGAGVTVRRVDVMPQTRPTRMTPRAQQHIRPPLHPMPSHSHNQMHAITSNLRFFYSRANPGPPSPLKPVPAPPTHRVPSPPAASPAPNLPTPTHPAFPPPSPAFTRLSSSSSRKRPSLTRSKSDMSDRCSRAGTDMERFFNLCGLDPTELEVLTGPGSDVVSIARFRSASAPGSECAGSGREEEEEEGDEAGRAPHSVSVIERNARVIKWLYGIRQAKDTARSTNM